jgi:hypothetical protein
VNGNAVIDVTNVLIDKMKNGERYSGMLRRLAYKRIDHTSSFTEVP